ncbi:arabinanase [Rickenella mellea]|uniref:Arabinan endo-1,5-alpha-L-arabinosidase n=1 Tax=Rickenella mellea TaxID=50990 RepID=A0A4Y7PJC3_9AGAM|nr:arabinanase [Rickenella mellea]
MSLGVASLAFAFPAPEYVTGDTSVHDPTMCKDHLGKYFIFSTGVGLEIRTSIDRIEWTRVGVVWPDGAPWTDEYTGNANGSLWAPDCTYINGEFNLYYAASSFGSQNSAIFFAKSATGMPGNWSDYGLVTSTSTSNDYNAIDPKSIFLLSILSIPYLKYPYLSSLIIHNGRWYLSLGSFWTGIKEIMLSSKTGRPLSDKISSIAERTDNSGSTEASVIYRHGRYFYLFTSWDFCCRGTNSTYNIRAGRSDRVEGPFMDKSGVPLIDGGGTIVLESHGSIVGPGGQDLFIDRYGPILVYHYYTSNGSFLGINKLDFSDGWPMVV